MLVNKKTNENILRIAIIINIYMNKLLSFIAKETSGKSFNTHKYCFEEANVPNIIYDDNKNITLKKYGETEKITSMKPLKEKAEKVLQYSKPIFKYFLDGSYRSYKVDDIAYGNRVYPIIAGQIGIGCCLRDDFGNMLKCILEHHLVFCLPDCANKDDSKNENKKILFFNNLLSKINNNSFLLEKNIIFYKIFSYEDRVLNTGEKYEDLAIAKIQDEMVENEKRIVSQLTRDNKLNENSYLLKDGSLEYRKLETGDYRDLSIIKSNYKRVVGVSKSFNPERCIDANKQSNATKIAELPLYFRTPAFMYESTMASGKEGKVKFANWYLRIRDAKFTNSPFEGIIKIEKILVSEKEQEIGLDSEEIDLISASLINERNPVCYGKDSRWANHLYPVYLTESYIKSNYFSNQYFLNLF